MAFYKEAFGAAAISCVKPQLFVEAPKASAAVQFYKEAFGAEELTRTAVSCVKPQLFVEAPKASAAVQFYKEAFRAEELNRGATHPKCSELKLGLSVFMICHRNHQQESLVCDGSMCGFCLEAEDVEAVVAKAVEAGALVVEQVSDADEGCCGGRSGKVKDPFGYVWAICATSSNYCVGVTAR